MPWTKTWRPFLVCQNPWKKNVSCCGDISPICSLPFSINPGGWPPLNGLVCRDAIWVLRNILAPRSEELSGFSLLNYLNTLLNSTNCTGLEPISSAFLTEIEHLLKGCTGISGIYKEKPPAFLRHSGRRAAKMRSADLFPHGEKFSSFHAPLLFGTG